MIQKEILKMFYYKTLQLKNRRKKVNALSFDNNFEYIIFKFKKVTN